MEDIKYFSELLLNNKCNITTEKLTDTPWELSAIQKNKIILKNKLYDDIRELSIPELINYWKSKNIISKKRSNKRPFNKEKRNKKKAAAKISRKLNRN